MYRDLGLIKGLGCRDEANAAVNLYYADDTLIFGGGVSGISYDSETDFAVL